ncbi:hypothetical protein BD413DRAFT_134666 [Trametes elegans]|nr:hypothetical protein BD413DRAFT_134666 [Trametes elegans]
MAVLCLATKVGSQNRLARSPGPQHASTTAPTTCLDMHAGQLRICFMENAVSTSVVPTSHHRKVPVPQRRRDWPVTMATCTLVL